LVELVGVAGDLERCYYFVKEGVLVRGVLVKRVDRRSEVAASFVEAAARIEVAEDSLFQEKFDHQQRMDLKEHEEEREEEP
jgi:ribosomal protein L24